MLFKGWRMMLFLTGLRSAIYLDYLKGDRETWRSILLLEGSLRGTWELMQRQEEGIHAALQRALCPWLCTWATTARDMVRVCDQRSGEAKTRLRRLWVEKGLAWLSPKTWWFWMIIRQMFLIMKKICPWNELKRTVPSLDILKSKLIIFLGDSRKMKRSHLTKFRLSWEEKAVFGWQRRRNDIS